jgi:F-type H+-transporting ATPase subunit b
MDIYKRQNSGIGSQEPGTTIKNIIGQTFLLIAVMLIPGFAFGSGGQEIHMSLMDWVWRLLNFSILVGVIYLFGWKLIRDHLKQRRELIKQSIKESQEAKAMAARALGEVEERLKLKDSEINSIVAAAVETGEREKTRLIEEGEKMKARIVEQARANIEFEMKKAKQGIQAEAVEASLKIAEEKIKSRMTSKEQARLLKESIKMIEGKN